LGFNILLKKSKLYYNMNNRKLTSFINMYGGNDDPNNYTRSLLEKYNNINHKTNIIKIKNLELLLYDSENESENMIFVDLFDDNKNTIKLDNLNNDNPSNIESSEPFTEMVSNVMKNKYKKIRK